MVSLLVRSSLFIIVAIAISLLGVESASILDGEVSEEYLNDFEVDVDISNSIDDDDKMKEHIFIPFALYRKMDKISNTTEFINKFVLNDTTLKMEYRKNTPSNIANTTGCIPKDTVVVVPLNLSYHDYNASILYYPKGTIVKRCGGCCTNSVRFSCQPVKQEMREMKVLKLEYTNRSDQLLTFKGFKTAQVPEHKECKCDCRVKPKDCNDRQYYNATQCMCFCKNEIALKSQCVENIQYWNQSLCECKCRKPQNCTTGSVFDETTCKCIVNKNLNYPIKVNHMSERNCPNSVEKAECKNKYWNSTTCACEKPDTDTKTLQDLKYLLSQFCDRLRDL